jgi:hypothetical protein
MKLSNSTRCIAAGVAGVALAGLVAVPATAEAAEASSGASASLTFQSSTINAGTQPELTFITGGTPAGSVVYVEEAGAGKSWHAVGRISQASGTVRAPADSAGMYEYRVVVASAAGQPIVTSAPAALTVTGEDGALPASSTPTPSASAAACTACTVATKALPWLALVVDPSSVWATITSILSAIGDAIAAIFGL